MIFKSYSYNKIKEIKHRFIINNTQMKLMGTTTVQDLGHETIYVYHNLF